MKIRFLIFAPALLLAACNQQAPAPQDETGAAAPPTESGQPNTTAERPATAVKRQSQVLPSGFVLPFDHEIRADRQEKLGGATKHRVIAEVRGISLDEANSKISEAVTRNGFSQLERTERDNGFVVSYETPDGKQLQTSFFERGEIEYGSDDATGVVHITWIVRR